MCSLLHSINPELNLLNLRSCAVITANRMCPQKDLVGISHFLETLHKSKLFQNVFIPEPPNPVNLNIKTSSQ